MPVITIPRVWKLNTVNNKHSLRESESFDQTTTHNVNGKMSLNELILTLKS